MSDGARQAAFGFWVLLGLDLFAFLIQRLEAGSWNAVVLRPNVAVVFGRLFVCMMALATIYNPANGFLQPQAGLGTGVQPPRSRTAGGQWAVMALACGGVGWIALRNGNKGGWSAIVFGVLAGLVAVGYQTGALVLSTS